MIIPNSFDLKSLQVFVVTAEQGGMTKSAQVLELTQSAVSQTIANLENALDIPLFDRSVRPIALTPGGKILLARAWQIIQDTQDTFRETQNSEQRRLPSLTIAMTGSMSTVLSAKLYKSQQNLSTSWRIWAGLSPYHREEFLSHNIDIMIATQDVMDDVADLKRIHLFKEPFVLIFPKSYNGPVDLAAIDRDLPFLKFSMRSALGARITSQLTRMHLRYNSVLEFDNAPSLTTAVAEGLGWGITTPLCLLSKSDLIEHIQVYPIVWGEFYRQFDLLCREGSLGNLPDAIADEARRLLKEECLPKIYGAAPWIERDLGWGNSRQDGAD